MRWKNVVCLWTSLLLMPVKAFKRPDYDDFFDPPAQLGLEIVAPETDFGVALEFENPVRLKLAEQDLLEDGLLDGDGNYNVARYCRQCEAGFRRFCSRCLEVRPHRYPVQDYPGVAPPKVDGFSNRVARPDVLTSSTQTPLAALQSGTVVASLPANGAQLPPASGSFLQPNTALLQQQVGGVQQQLPKQQLTQSQLTQPQLTQPQLRQQQLTQQQLSQQQLTQQQLSQQQLTQQKLSQPQLRVVNQQQQQQLQNFNQQAGYLAIQSGQPAAGIRQPLANTNYGPAGSALVQSGYNTGFQTANSFGQLNPQSYGTSNRPTQNFGVPSQSYRAPSQNYQNPSQSYGTPSQSYGTPSQSYGTPSQSYGTPSQSYGTPSQSYGAPNRPSQSYGAPNRPSQSYGAPNRPSQGYGTPNSKSQKFGFQGNSRPSQSYGPPKSQKSRKGGKSGKGRRNSSYYRRPSSSYGGSSKGSGSGGGKGGGFEKDKSKIKSFFDDLFGKFGDKGEDDSYESYSDNYGSSSVQRPDYFGDDEHDGECPDPDKQHCKKVISRKPCLRYADWECEKEEKCCYQTCLGHPVCTKAKKSWWKLW